MRNEIDRVVDPPLLAVIDHVEAAGGLALHDVSHGAVDGRVERGVIRAGPCL